MIDERTEESTTLYALDLLEPAEARAFDARLETEADLRVFVDQMREAASALAHAAPPRFPRAELEARILAEIRASKTVEFSSAKGIPAWIPWALAACLTAFCGLIWSDYAHLKQELAQLQNRDEFAHVQVATLGSKLAGAPSAKAVVIWDQEKQRGVVKLDEVPEPAAGHDYQLWIIDPHFKQPISAGVIPADYKTLGASVFSVEQPISQAQKFAISVEKKGGSLTPEGPIVFISD